MIRNDIRSAISEMSLRTGASMKSINEVEQSLGLRFPQDFKQFLVLSDGAIGFVGSNYVELWSVKEIEDFNQALELRTISPDLLAFGTDGANEIYAFKFDETGSSIVQAPMIGISLDDIWNCAASFSDFILGKCKS
jgi:hypothetical protein